MSEFRFYFTGLSNMHRCCAFSFVLAGFFLSVFELILFGSYNNADDGNVESVTVCLSVCVWFGTESGLWWNESRVGGQRVAAQSWSTSVPQHVHGVSGRCPHARTSHEEGSLQSSQDGRRFPQVHCCLFLNRLIISRNFAEYNLQGLSLFQKNSPPFLFLL